MPLQAVLQVLNPLGLHARPAAEFVRCAQRFSSTHLRLIKDGDSFAPTSILEVLSACLDCGAQFTLEADGPQAAEALTEFTSLLVRIRDEELADS